MDYSTFPQQQDVEAYVTSLGLINTDDLPDVLRALRLDVKADAAKAAWERDTGYTPFIKDTADVTRWFEPQGSAVLDLEGGLLTLTSVTTGYSTSYAGQALVQNTDFYLDPVNAGTDGRPWTQVRFGWRQWGLPRSIVIVGRWGYAATVPPDAWNAVLVKAAILAQPELSAMIGRGLAGVKTEETDIRYVQASTTPLSAELKVWEASYMAAVQRFHRWEL